MVCQYEIVDFPNFILCVSHFRRTFARFIKNRRSATLKLESHIKTSTDLASEMAIQRSQIV